MRECFWWLRMDGGSRALRLPIKPPSSARCASKWRRCASSWPRRTELSAQAAARQELQAQLSALQAQQADLNTLRQQVEALRAEVKGLRANTVLDLNGYLTFDVSNGYPTALFRGINVQIVNGTGDTQTINGMGNLIVGYNRPSNGSFICSIGTADSEAACVASGGVWAQSHKSGSHNIVGGDFNSYSSWGGLVLGLENALSAPYAAITRRGPQSRRRQLRERQRRQLQHRERHLQQCERGLRQPGERRLRGCRRRDEPNRAGCARLGRGSPVPGQVGRCGLTASDARRCSHRPPQSSAAAPPASWRRKRCFRPACGSTSSMPCRRSAASFSSPARVA